MGKVIVFRTAAEMNRATKNAIDKYIADGVILDAKASLEEAAKARKRAAGSLGEAKKKRRRIQKIQRQNEWLSARVAHEEMAMKVYAALFGGIGGLLGTAAAVSTLLEYHGPTVTVIGTMGAMVIYIIIGLILAIIFTGMGVLQACNTTTLFRHRIGVNKADIEKLERRIETLDKLARCRVMDAERLEKEAKRFKKEAEQIRRRNESTA